MAAYRPALPNPKPALSHAASGPGNTDTTSELTLRCGARLLYGQSRGRSGQHYQYFFCADRHEKRSDCQLPYLLLAQVEHAVANHWAASGLPQKLVNRLGDQLRADLALQDGEQQADRDRLTKRMESLKRERYKWAEKAKEGTVPDDIAREKQQSLRDQLTGLEAALARTNQITADHKQLLDDALALLQAADAAYARADDKQRREYNQAFYAGLDLDSDDDTVLVSANHPTPLIATLREAATELNQRCTAQPHESTEASLDAQVELVMRQRSRRGVHHSGSQGIRGSNVARWWS